MTKHSLRHPLLALALVGTVFSGLALTSEPAHTDDRDILRFNTAKPYLFLILDTSSSMNLKVGAGDIALPGDGDNPESRIFAAKEALYEVFEDISDVHFGFATFNQNSVAVLNTHWIYYTQDDIQTLDPNWPIAYPTLDPDTLTISTTQPVDTDGDGIDDGFDDFVEGDIDGDALTFGPHIFAIDSDNDGTGDTQADEYGSCASPVSLPALFDEDREMMNRFSRAVPGATYFWIEDGGTTYRITVTAAGVIGSDPLTVTWTAEQATSCAPVTLAPVSTVNLDFILDSRLNEHVQIDGTPPPGGKNGNTVEPIPGFYETSDILQSASCGDGSPFTGEGWEGNYDSDDHNLAITGATFDSSIVDNDAYKVTVGPTTYSTEIRPMEHTTYDPLGRAVDYGDVIPLDWRNDYLSNLLQRLAPNASLANRFGVAAHIADLPDAGTGTYGPKLSGRPPIIASGETPLGKAILDFRCFWQGSGTNKCRTRGYDHYSTPDGTSAGWDDIACTYDSDWGCRKPYLILITDGEDTCAGESPAADTANLNSKNGIQTWGLNLGDPRGCQAGSDLKKTTQNGKGECINVANKFELRTAIRDILGVIREEARAFASAAVPTVQADAAQTVYLSNFTPLNGKAVWDGHINNYLKPIPLNTDGTPDPTHPNHQWDGGEVMVTDQYTNASDPIGNGTGQRRVYWASDSEAGAWGVYDSARTSANGFRLMDPTTGNDPPSTADYDLFDIWNIGYATPADPLVDTVAHTEANDIITSIFALKTATLIDTGETLEYLLGDVFHSDPVVIQSPNNGTYLRLDLESNNQNDDKDCGVDPTASNFDTGYRCFFERQRLRRHTISVGSNDGMLHIFNGAQYDNTSQEFDTGTGHEIQAYMPRLVLPTVREIYYDTPDAHQYTVDGPPNAADVFIDPIFGAGGPTDSERRWHTILVSGIREGGAGYFALDMSQPDQIEVDPDRTGGYRPTAPNYLATCGAANGYSNTNCGPVPYGAPIWEFLDTEQNQDVVMAPVQGYIADEERDVNGLSVGNGTPDLADSWSEPRFGRIRVCDTTVGSDCTATPDQDPAGGVIDKYVVIFGGGLDAGNKTAAQAGDFLYMVDVETGQVIYKRRLLNPYSPSNGALVAQTGAGSVASAPATLDLDLDGFIDRIYVTTVGTTAGSSSPGGFVFRIDLSEFDAGGSIYPYPEIASEDINVIYEDGTTGTEAVYRVERTYSDGTTVWDPLAIFDAGWADDGTGSFVTTTQPRPIYFEPAVVAAQFANSVGIGVGTGDREDLWNLDQMVGRFYFFLDDSDLAPASLPFTEEDFAEIDDADPNTSVNYLVTRSVGERGWYLTLNENERVTAPAFSLVGITFFPTFEPDIGVTDANGNPIGDAGCGSSGGGLCSKQGTSRVFLTSALNANGLLEDDAGNEERSLTQPTFVTEPFTSFGQSKNDGQGSDPCEGAADDLVRELFPTSCKFTNARIDIELVTADTAASCLASIPICLQNNNWKEF